MVFLFIRHLGLDLVPRKDFEVVDSDQISVSDLYKMVRNLNKGGLFLHSSFFSFVFPDNVVNCMFLKQTLKKINCPFASISIFKKQLVLLRCHTFQVEIQSRDVELTVFSRAHFSVNSALLVFPPLVVVNNMMYLSCLL